jgi:heme/copper-type cytochrome/quinol oxidase subunit 2
MRPLLVAAGAIAVAVALFFVFRPSDDGGETKTTTTARTSATTTARTTTATAPSRTRIVIVVRNGSVVGGLRHATVKQGMPVELFVTADVSDEVHLHGYDRMRDVAPGAPAHLFFTATTPGRFEVELESRKLEIAEITVEP